MKILTKLVLDQTRKITKIVSIWLENFNTRQIAGEKNHADRNSSRFRAEAHPY